MRAFFVVRVSNWGRLLLAYCRHSCYFRNGSENEVSERLLTTHKRPSLREAVSDNIYVMISTKRLRSVAQSTAHHAVSGLCYLHPHLGDRCRKNGTTWECVLLIGENVVAPSNDGPISLATDALRGKFDEILQSEGGQQSDISTAVAFFEFNRGSWPSACAVKISTESGSEVEVAVGSDGRSAEILSTRK